MAAPRTLRCSTRGPAGGVPHRPARRSGTHGRPHARALRGLLGALVDHGLAAATINQRYRSLHPIFAFLAEEDEIESNPMERLRSPKIAEQPVPVLTEDQIRAVLATAKGRDFLNVCHRDHAPAARHRHAPRRAARPAHRRRRPGPGRRPRAGLGTPLTNAGLQKMLERRAAPSRAAPHPPHQFRHTFSHNGCPPTVTKATFCASPAGAAAAWSAATPPRPPMSGPARPTGAYRRPSPAADTGAGDTVDTKPPAVAFLR